MTDYRPQRSEVFVLRFWQEASSGTWHGQAVHVPGDETFAFATWEQVRSFLGQFIYGLEAGSPRPQAGG